MSRPEYSQQELDEMFGLDQSHTIGANSEQEVDRLLNENPFEDLETMSEHTEPVASTSDDMETVDPESTQPATTSTSEDLEALEKDLGELNLGAADPTARKHDLSLDLEDFNGWSQIFKDQNNIKEFINLQTGGAFESHTGKTVRVVVDPVFQNHLPPDDTNDITLTVDIDMLGIMSGHIPMLPRSAISLNLDPTNEFTSTICPMYHNKHLHEISNMLLGQYGDASRLKLYIFFPHLYHQGETKTQASLRMREDTRTSFIENVLFQALRCNESIAHLYPISIKDEIFRKRSVAGTIINAGTFVMQQHMVMVVDAMRKIIAEPTAPMTRETSLAQFREFFFYTHSYGIKQHIPYSMTKPEEEGSIALIVRAAINDVNWDDILDEHVVLDLAVNIGVQGHTGLWIAQLDDKRHGHLTNRLLHMFLEGMRIASSRYRHDMFAYISTLGGFRYYARNKVQGDGPCHILSMQAYHTIKTPFYIARRGSSRTSHDISVEQLVFQPSTADYIMDGTRDIFYGIQDTSYPARFELSLRLTDAQHFYENIRVYVQRILDEQAYPCLVFYETSIVCGLGIHKIDALQYMYKSIRNAGIDLRVQDPHLMTLICYISVIFSGLVARPDSFAYQQRFIQFLYNRAEYNSSLLLCPGLLYFEDISDCWTAQYAYNKWTEVFTPVGRYKLATFARIQHRTLPRLNRPNQLYSVPDINYYFHPVNYRGLEESRKLLFGIERMIPDVKQTYSALKEPTASIANMLITEGLNQKTALSLINFFAQDVWNLIGNTNAFRESFEYRTQMSLEYLNNVDAMNKVFNVPVHIRETKDQAILDRTFSILFPDTSETNLLDQIAEIEKGSRVYVSIYSRTAYVFVMNALSRLGRQEEAHQFHIMLREIAYIYLTYLPDIDSAFVWTKYSGHFSLFNLRVRDERTKKQKKKR